MTKLILAGQSVLCLEEKVSVGEYTEYLRIETSVDVFVWVEGAKAVEALVVGIDEVSMVGRRGLRVEVVEMGEYLFEYFLARHFSSHDVAEGDRVWDGVERGLVDIDAYAKDEVGDISATDSSLYESATYLVIAIVDVVGPFHAKARGIGRER